MIFERGNVIGLVGRWGEETKHKIKSEEDLERYKRWSEFKERKRLRCECSQEIRLVQRRRLRSRATLEPGRLITSS